MPNIKVTRPEFESYWVNRRRRKRRLDTLQNLLFGHGENGFLFGNFAELDELFLLSTGNTGNVAANDDPVGRALDDHSWGGASLAAIIAAATEMVTNGAFSDGTTTGWTASNGTLSAVNGALRLTNTAGGVASARQQAFTTVVGSTYRATLNFKTDGQTGNSFLNIGTSAGGSDIAQLSMGSVVGVYSLYFVATATTTHLSFSQSSSALAGEFSEFDEVSCKLVPGNHALQATAANRPLWKANAGKPYLLFDGTNDALVTGLVPNATAGWTSAVAFNLTTASTIALGGGTTSGNKRATIGVNGSGLLTIGWGTAVAQSPGADIRNANTVVVVTGDLAARSIYLNGVNVTSSFVASAGGPDGTGGEMTIGARRDSAGGTPDSLINGNVRAALVRNRVSSPAEIARITADFQSTF